MDLTRASFPQTELKHCTRRGHVSTFLKDSLAHVVSIKAYLKDGRRTFLSPSCSFRYQSSVCQYRKEINLEVTNWFFRNYERELNGDHSCIMKTLFTPQRRWFKVNISQCLSIKFNEMIKKPSLVATNSSRDKICLWYVVCLHQISYWKQTAIRKERLVSLWLNWLSRR
jgi:hypothetical protein